jgi:hypothetical protein
VEPDDRTVNVDPGRRTPRATGWKHCNKVLPNCESIAGHRLTSTWSAHRTGPQFQKVDETPMPLSAKSGEASPVVHRASDRAESGRTNLGF